MGEREKEPIRSKLAERRNCTCSPSGLADATGGSGDGDGDGDEGCTDGWDDFCSSFCASSLFGWSANETRFFPRTRIAGVG